MAMASGQQYEIITILDSFSRASPGFENNIAPYADQAGINWFVRLDADLDDNTAEVIVYDNGALKGAIRKRSGSYAFVAAPTSSHEFRANTGDRYAKIQQEKTT